MGTYDNRQKIKTWSEYSGLWWEDNILTKSHCSHGLALAWHFWPLQLGPPVERKNETRNKQLGCVFHEYLYGIPHHAACGRFRSVFQLPREVKARFGL